MILSKKQIINSDEEINNIIDIKEIIKSEADPSILNYLIIDEENDQAMIKIPTTEIFDIFSPAAIERLVTKKDVFPIEQELNAMGLEKAHRQGKITNDGYLELTWSEIKVDHLQLYKKEFPAPIPTIYQIPLAVMQNLLHSNKYKVYIEVEGQKVSIRKNVAGVFQSEELCMNDLEKIVEQKSCNKVKYVKLFNREFIFQVI